MIINFLSLLNPLIKLYVWFHSVFNIGEDYGANILYNVYDSSSGVLKTWTRGEESFEALNCLQSESLAFVIHGWMKRENDHLELDPIAQKLITAHPGCVVNVKYLHYADKWNYPELLTDFKGIQQEIQEEILQFFQHGIKPEKTFIFGFSMGAQLALHIGRDLSKQGKKISRIDVCEPTSVGFSRTGDSKLAAENVQCIHTDSKRFGTTKRDCHQDFLMGECGFSQIAADSQVGNHLLCVRFYNSAFANDFQAIPKPSGCSGPKATNITDSPDMKMGFYTNTNLKGLFYAKTTESSPYN